MKILITNHWLRKLGGSETFTYALAKELRDLGLSVDLFAIEHGLVSDRIVGLGVGTELKTRYDLILANHNTTVEKVHNLGTVIQTCHGTIPKLEQPNSKADMLVAISNEVARHIESKGLVCDNVILNGIDCERFSPKPLNDRPKRVLSLCHSDEANRMVKKACDIAGVELMTINKYRKQIWDMENRINSADIVISLGRGAYEAMACGRPVIVFDKRPYQDAMAEGYVTEENIDTFIDCNCSGRATKRKMDANGLANEIRKYDKKDGDFLRDYAISNLNIKTNVDRYLKMIL